MQGKGTRTNIYKKCENTIPEAKGCISRPCESVRLIKYAKDQKKSAENSC